MEKAVGEGACPVREPEAGVEPKCKQDLRGHGLRGGQSLGVAGMGWVA